MSGPRYVTTEQRRGLFSTRRGCWDRALLSPAWLGQIKVECQEQATEQLCASVSQEEGLGGIRPCPRVFKEPLSPWHHLHRHQSSNSWESETFLFWPPHPDLPAHSSGHCCAPCHPHPPPPNPGLSFWFLHGEAHLFSECCPLEVGRDGRGTAQLSLRPWAQKERKCQNASHSVVSNSCDPMIL